MAVELNDIITYLETTLATDQYLKGNIKFTYEANPIPAIRDYGAHIYCGIQPIKEERPHKIGPWLLETWSINVDIILNKSFKPRESMSNSLGVSYWSGRVKDLLLHGTNGGLFRDSSWLFLYPESTDMAQILHGVFKVEIENRYS